jgi:DNA replication and repair protein RecF
MQLQRLNVQNLRNLTRVDISLSHKVNAFVGANGVGKTSLLEAVHFLGLGRSFRSASHRPIIREGEDQLLIFGEFEPLLRVGCEKGRQSDTRIKINGETASSSAELAARLPIQVLHADTLNLIDGGPIYRRKFIDWGVFHVEHQFGDHWRRCQRLLQQRNALLRAGRPQQEVAAWDEALLPLAQSVTESRKRFLADYIPMLEAWLAEKLDLPFKIKFYQGWDGEKTYQAALSDNFARDSQLGYSQSGPHRADLRLRLYQQPAQHVLSRGQLKSLVCAMCLSQVAWLHAQTGKTCLILLDDIAAELDKENQARVAASVAELPGQVFLTGIDEASVQDFVGDAGGEMFHVEQLVREGAVASEL